MAVECENKLIVIALASGLDNYEEVATDQLWDFVSKSLGGTIENDILGFPLLANTYPTPKVKSESDDMSWEEEHWGTASEVLDANYDDLEIENHLLLYFDSYETPPLAWLEKMSEEYPLLWFKLQFDTPDGDIFGSAMATNGRLIFTQLNFNND